MLIDIVWYDFISSVFVCWQKYEFLHRSLSFYLFIYFLQSLQHNWWNLLFWLLACIDSNQAGNGQRKKRKDSQQLCQGWELNSKWQHWESIAFAHRALSLLLQHTVSNNISPVFCKTTPFPQKTTMDSHLFTI